MCVHITCICVYTSYNVCIYHIHVYVPIFGFLKFYSINLFVYYANTTLT